MAIVFVPAPLRRLTDGRDRLEVPGDTVGALVDAIERAHPGFRERVVADGELRASLAVSVDGDLVTRGLDEPVRDTSEVHFVPALGGGQSPGRDAHRATRVRRSPAAKPCLSASSR